MVLKGDQGERLSGTHSLRPKSFAQDESHWVTLGIYGEANVHYCNNERKQNLPEKPHLYVLLIDLCSCVSISKAEKYIVNC